MYDIMILNFIKEYFHSNVGDAFFVFITYLGEGGFIWILLALFLILLKKEYRLGISMFVALSLVGIVCLLIVKPMVARERPFYYVEGIQLLIKKPTDFSFPSGHTASSFAAVTVLFLNKSKSFKPTLVLAVLISFSRLYLYVHYPSDVLFGIIFGVLLAYIANKVVNEISKKIKT
ncbi:phosphatase PAP2 family protein [Peptostreptococcus faecalis]|uniref:phosphatase PAP2 family protein n=1 Tax=Peptostreptococcus faecalis TaxID=2045015 RepID=UPI000C7D66A1|nr:phosphatase PAP2 family protein [Peptostreptococcus faecalis]